MQLIYLTVALPCGQGETFILAEAAALRAKGHRVTLIPMRPARDQTIPHGDADAFHDPALTRPLLSAGLLLEALRTVIRRPVVAAGILKTLLASRNPCMLAKNLAVLPKSAWIARVARELGADHIHAHFASTNATAALIASRLSGVPWSLTAHRWDIRDDNLLPGKAGSAGFLRAIDERGAMELARRAGIPRSRVRLLHMGVMPAANARREGSSHVPIGPYAPLRVLLGARVDGLKGHVETILAVQRLRETGETVLLDCVGDGPKREEYERLVRTLDLGRQVRFHGLRDHRLLLEQLAGGTWDAAVLSSVENASTREGIPVILMEAMAAGVPVIGSDTGGIPELLHGNAGLLVPQNNPEAIANAFQSLANDPELRQRLSDAGRRRIRESFDAAAVAEVLIGWFTADAHASIASAKRTSGVPDPLCSTR